MEAFTTDPLRASVHLRSLSERVRTFDRALLVGPAALDPFRGQTTIGKSWREEILASRDFEPIRQPMLAFVDYLFERRLNLGVALQESALLTAEQVAAAPFERAGSWSERRLMALAASADPERQEEARAAWRVISTGAPGLSAVRVLRYERHIEIEGRLGARLSPLVTFEADTGGVESLARLLLTCTKDAAGTLLGSGWSGLVSGATGSPAVEGWPARLGPDTLLSLFGGRWLIAALDTASASFGRELGAGDLPERVCPSSFGRAAIRFGQEVVSAATPETVPFVVARTPTALYGRAFGRVLALWLGSAACARRYLGLGGEGRSRHARGMARQLLAEGRLLAARALLAEAGRHSRARLDETWEELGPLLCGHALGPPLGLFAAPPEASGEFVAHLWALHLWAELIQTYDEDFLDNPRAREVILDAVHGLEPSPPAHAALQTSCLAFARTLEQES